MAKKIETKSLRNLYEIEKNKPTAAQEFVTTLMAITKRSEIAVRQWLSGVREPDALVKETLSKHFGIPAESLFPKN